MVLYSSICPLSFSRVRVQANTSSTLVLEAKGPPTSMKPCLTIIISYVWINFWMKNSVPCNTFSVHTWGGEGGGGGGGCEGVRV